MILVAGTPGRIYSCAVIHTVCAASHMIPKGETFRGLAQVARASVAPHQSRNSRVFAA